MNKHILPGALAVMLTTLACGLNISTTAATQPDVATIVAATLQSYTAAPPAPNATPTLAASQQNGIAFSASPIKFVIPGGLANGAIAENMEAVTAQTGAPR